MPVLGLVRAAQRRARHRRGRAGHRARRARAHLGGLRPRRGRRRRVRAGGPHRTDPGQRPDRGRRARRRLQQPDPDVLARLRHLGRLEHHRERQLPAAAQHQDASPTGAPRRSGSGSRPTPSSTPARWRTCATIECEVAVIVTDADERAPRASSTWSAASSRTRHVQVFSEVEPGARRGTSSGAASRCSTGPGRTSSSPSAAARSSTPPRRCGSSTSTRRRPSTTSRCRSSTRASGWPTTRGTRTPCGWSRCRPPPGTGSEVSPAAVLTVGERKETLVDYSLVPDVAIVDPMLTLSMPPSVTADSGIDALTHALEAAVSIFASPYTDAFCVQAARLIFDALPRVARRARRPRRPHRHGQRGDAGRAGLLQRLRRHQPRARARGRRAVRDRRTAGPTGSSCRTCCATTPALPSKFMPAPGYSAYVAPDKYAQLGRVVFGGREPEESRRRLFQGVEDLLDRLGMPRSLRGAGRRRGRVPGARCRELAMTRVRGPEQPDQPADAAGQRAHRAAPARVRRGAARCRLTATPAPSGGGAVRRPCWPRSATSRASPSWIPEILDAELLEVYEDDGLPATARFKASATVGTDEYTLSYEHTDDTMSWTMLEGRMQTGQEGCYTLRERGAGADRGHLRAHHPPQPAAARVRPPPGDLGAGREHPDRPAHAPRGLSGPLSRPPGPAPAAPPSTRRCRRRAPGGRGWCRSRR